uniref:Uncharacterized protein n=1 Tax=Ananas comosus var. bracteatus TaxID=296719 RepID=A0A6V7PW42_ANACO|nr:unnamed protein product [Ananas comosus var. bracteatus]
MVFYSSCLLHSSNQHHPRPRLPSPALSFARATLARPFLRPRHPRSGHPRQRLPSAAPPSPAPFFARAFLRPHPLILNSLSAFVATGIFPPRCRPTLLPLRRARINSFTPFFEETSTTFVPQLDALVPFCKVDLPIALDRQLWALELRQLPFCKEAARLLYLSASPTAIQKISLHLISGLGLLYKFGLLSIQGNDGQSKNYEAQVINRNRASKAARKDVGFQPQKPFLRSQSKKSEPIPPSSEDPHVSQCPPTARIDQPASPNAANPDVNSTGKVGRLEGLPCLPYLKPDLMGFGFGSVFQIRCFILGPRCLHLGKLIVYILV